MEKIKKFFENLFKKETEEGEYNVFVIIGTIVISGGILLLILMSVIPSDNQESSSVNMPKTQREVNQSNFNIGNTNPKQLNEEKLSEMLKKEKLQPKEIKLILLSKFSQNLKVLKEVFQNKSEFNENKLTKLLTAEDIGLNKKQVNDIISYDNQKNLRINYNKLSQYLTMSKTEKSKEKKENPTAAKKETVAFKNLLIQRDKQYQKRMGELKGTIKNLSEQLKKNNDKVEEIKEETNDKLEEKEKQLKELKEKTEKLETESNNSKDKEKNKNKNKDKDKKVKTAREKREEEISKLEQEFYNSAFKENKNSDNYNSNSNNNDITSNSSSNSQQQRTLANWSISDNSSSNSSWDISSNPIKKEEKSKVKIEKGITSGTMIKVQSELSLINSNAFIPAKLRVLENIKDKSGEIVIPKGAFFLGEANPDYNLRKLFVKVNKLIINDKEIEVSGRFIKENGEQALATEIYDPQKANLFKSLAIDGVKAFFNGLKDFTTHESDENGMVQKIYLNNKKNAAIDASNSTLEEWKKMIMNEAKQKGLIITVKSGIKGKIYLKEKIPYKYLK